MMGVAWKGARPDTVLLERHLVRLPLPDDLQLDDIRGGDLLGRRVLRVRLLGADIRPLDHSGKLLGVSEVRRHQSASHKGTGHT